ncbi:MAG: transport-associated protein [Thermodesulfobacteriota bacterium]
MTDGLKSFFLILIMTLPLALMGCGDEPGPTEKAGKKINQAFTKGPDKAKELTK